jgi:hypothetical protein
VVPAVCEIGSTVSNLGYSTMGEIGLDRLIDWQHDFERTRAFSFFRVESQF